MNITERLNVAEILNLAVRIERIEAVLTKIMRCIGLVGSALMFAVYSQPRVRQLSVSIYFRFMAATCLISNIDQFIINEFFLQIYQLSLHLGKFLGFIPKLFAPSSAWLEVLASLDRFLVIMFPFRFKFIQKTYIQLILIAAIFTINTFLYLYNMTGFKPIHVITGIAENVQGRTRISDALSIINLLNNSLIPFAIMSFTSVLTFMGVWRAHRRIKSMSRQPGTTVFFLNANSFAT